MFVGEAPGADEDRQGEPFVGRAGELLTKIIQTMGFQRSEVYIANVLKCRPDMPPGASGNRQPTQSEMETCLPYLRQQIEHIQPKVVVALGATAMRGLFGKVEQMKLMRGRWHLFGSIPVMATFHPSYLLRNQALSEKEESLGRHAAGSRPTGPSGQREAEKITSWPDDNVDQNCSQKIDSNRSRVLFPET